MSNWLGQGFNNLRDTLGDLTKEVLAETTEEVADPSTEIKVLRSKVQSIQSDLDAANHELEVVRTRNSNLEESLNFSDEQLKCLSERFRQQLADKDAEIRKMQNQIHGVESDFTFESTELNLDTTAGDGSHMSESPPYSPGTDMTQLILKDKIQQLTAEVNHWKHLVNTTAKTKSDGVSKTEHDSIREKYENELISLQESNSSAINDLKQYYEAKLKEMASSGVKQSDSWDTWGDDEQNEESKKNEEPELAKEGSLNMLHQLEKVQCLMDEAKLDKSEMYKEKHDLELELSKQKESNEKLKDEINTKSNADSDMISTTNDETVAQLQSQVKQLEESLETLDAENQLVVDKLLSSKNELSQMNISLTQELDSLKMEHSNLMKEFEQTKAENHELTSAYNDLNDELEKEKAESGDIVSSNRELNARLESLKADLIEYEEKYEKCKADNMRAMQQLELLTVDFDRLRNTLDNAQSGTRQECIQLNSDVNRLQKELKDCLTHRDTLITDVNKFKDVVDSVDEQMGQFKQLNSKLKEENEELKGMVTTLLGYKELFANTETELSDMREGIKRFELASVRNEKELREELVEVQEENSKLKLKLREAEAETEKDKETSETQEEDIVPTPSSPVSSQLSLIVDEAQQNNESNFQSKIKELEDIIVRYRDLVGEGASRIVEHIDENTNLGWTKVSNDGHAQSGSSGPDSPDGIVQKLEMDTGDSNGWDKMDEHKATPTGGMEQPTSGLISGDELERLRMQLREALTAVTEKSEHIQEIQEQLRVSNLNIKEKEEYIQQLCTEIQGVESQVEDQREREEGLRKNLHKLTNEIEVKDEAISRLQVDCEASYERETELQQRLNDVLLRQTNMENTIEEISEQQDSLDELNDKILSLQGEKSLIVKDLDKAKMDVELLTEAKERLEKDLNEQTESTNLLRESLEAVQDDHNKRLVALNSEIENLRNEAATNANTTAQLQELVDAQAQSSDNVALIEALQSQIKENGANLHNLEEEKRQLIELVNQKHEENVRYHEELQKVAVTVQEKENNLKIFEEKYNTMKIEMSQQFMGVQNELQGREELFRQKEGEFQKILEVCQNDLKMAKEASVSQVELSQMQSTMSQVEEQKENILKELQAERKRSEELAGKIKASEDLRVKTEKELQRLKAHLIQVEDNYTREAISNEERETDLRQRLRVAEEENLTHSQMANDTHKNMNDKVGDLSTQLLSLSTQRDQALLQLADYQEKLERSQKSLQSLQTVLQHFQQEKDSLVMDEVLRYREEKESLQKTLDSVRSELNAERLKYGKFEDDLKNSDHIRKKLMNRDSQIINLDLELKEKEEDLVKLRSQLSQAKLVQGSKADKDILKSLVLGYFSAPQDKKAEVAHLLGAVLDFSPEDFKKIEGSASGWLAFLGRGGGRAGGPSDDKSITAQFVKFLEQESTPSPQGTSRPAPPMSLLDEGGHDSHSRSSTPAGSYLRQQMNQQMTPNNSLLVSGGAFDLPTFANAAGENVLRPPSTSSDILKGAMNQ